MPETPPDMPRPRLLGNALDHFSLLLESDEAPLDVETAREEIIMSTRIPRIHGRNRLFR
jgi:hypothetical protein